MKGDDRFWNIWILLGLLHLSQTTVTPRTSFLIGSAGRVLSWFNGSDVRNTTTLLLSSDAETLFVGGRGVVLSLNVSGSDSITLKNKFDWVESEKPPCNSEGSNKNCGNFIQILQFINSTHLYACGSGAFKPQYTILSADSLKVSRKPEFVKGHCPYNGSERSTATVVDGKLFTATTTDYFAKDPGIFRYFSDDKKKLQLSDRRVLEGPTFISSSYVPGEGKVLFFFRENGTEYNFMSKFTVSRVAQVCTDDRGGDRILQNQWTSFAKSPLICQVEKQLPFNMLQDIIMLPAVEDKSPDDTVFYGIFTSQWALASGQSAVCSFTLADIKAAFSGNYQIYNARTVQWKEEPNINSLWGKCGLHNASDITLNSVKTAYLTSRSVQAVGHKPLLTSREELYSRIAAQRVQASNGHVSIILYLLSEAGYLHKIVLLKDRYHIIEAIQVFKQPQTIKSILLSVNKGVVFVGSSEGVARVPVSNCSFYSSCAECVLAQDPFCGWDPEGRQCVPVSNMNSNLYQDVENGNVTEQCKHDAVILKVVYAQMYQVVKLPCASSSSLEHVNWRFSNHSIIPQSFLLQQQEGNLQVLVTPNTAVEFHCIAETQGLQQTMAIFSLKEQASSHFSHLHPMDEDSLNMSFTHLKNYYNEMLAVSFMLALSLCALAVITVWWWRQTQSTVSPGFDELSECQVQAKP